MGVTFRIRNGVSSFFSYFQVVVVGGGGGEMSEKGNVLQPLNIFSVQDFTARSGGSVNSAF